MDAMPDTIALRPVGAVVHPTALVARGAELGRGVRIGPYCTVGADAVIEDRRPTGVTCCCRRAYPDRSRRGAVSVLHRRTRAAGSEILPASRRAARSARAPRSASTARSIAAPSTGKGITRVGADCMLMAVAHVAHDCTLGDHVIVANNVVMGGHVSIADHAVIGGAAAIHQFVRIGRAAMIGGVSGVEGDVIPFGSVIGNRARLAGLNVVGLKRRGFDKSQIQLLHTASATCSGARVCLRNGWPQRERAMATRRWWPRSWRSSTRQATGA